MAELMAAADNVVEFSNVTKRFASLTALEDVNLNIARGSIHCILGENGAGKSTLMNVLFGLHQPTSGTLKINDKACKFRDAIDARNAGVGMVHQHYRLVEEMTVAENIMLGQEMVNGPFVDRELAAQRVKELSQKFGLHVDPDAKVELLPIGTKQRVEILKALSYGSDILIFDEPTAVLTPQEAEKLFEVVQKLRSIGKTILFVTHKVKEVIDLADSLSVLRRGKLVSTLAVSEVRESEVAKLMVGRNVATALDKPSVSLGGPMLSVCDLNVNADNGVRAVDNVSFDVRKGEIVAIAGVEGNGQFELVEALAGVRRISSGKVQLLKSDLTDLSVAKRRAAGVCYIPEDRFDRGVARSASIAMNMTAVHFSRFEWRGFLNFKLIAKWVRQMMRKYDVRGEGAHASTASLSGGNAQKVILARELEANPKVVLAAQPARGLDIGATDFVHKQLLNAKTQDCCVVLVSADLDEVLRIADRILVIYRGHFSAEIDANLATKEMLGLAMMGISHAA